jgi:hypothetical protein
VVVLRDQLLVVLVTRAARASLWKKRNEEARIALTNVFFCLDNLVDEVS